MHFTPAIVIGLVVCIAVGVIPAIRILIAQRPRPHDRDESGGRHEPWLVPGPDGPSWWPEFEREFARYVATSPGSPERPG
ncbi:hypothetical protein DVA67_008175 [Solirubrobacter sp. CPCC 204708]|uniref:DUF2510 domain-containing protein n=1 Tax=Solirubrobacter deserti TaxID=2282478 RepID=A0ABT4RUS4_9ACTN|nr:hypothetical protein [Solirubrobacter deserti]MBE2315948.1 hypothetical protein [Solirubrobacter deserti]MDA0142332.1 hypothetical protein [Solirubrobacter deserti]